MLLLYFTVTKSYMNRIQWRTMTTIKGLYDWFDELICSLTCFLCFSHQDAVPGWRLKSVCRLKTMEGQILCVCVWGGCICACLSVFCTVCVWECWLPNVCASSCRLSAFVCLMCVSLYDNVLWNLYASTYSMCVYVPAHVRSHICFT